jgi:hypothetical protein
MLDFCLAYSSILQMEAACSSETTVDFQPITRRYVPEYRALPSFRFLYICSFDDSFSLFNDVLTE